MYIKSMQGMSLPELYLKGHADCLVYRLSYSNNGGSVLGVNSQVS